MTSQCRRTFAAWARPGHIDTRVHIIRVIEHTQVVVSESSAAETPLCVSVCRSPDPVSYTHLTLPTIYSV